MSKEPSKLGMMAKQCVSDSERWFGDSGVVHSIPHHTLAMAGEVGELANIVKKVERGSLRMGDANTRYEMAMELTDVFIYLLNLAGLMGVDLEAAYELKRTENERRFMDQRRAREANTNGDGTKRIVRDNPQA